MKCWNKLLLACTTSVLIVLALMRVSALPAAAAGTDATQNVSLCFPFAPNGAAGRETTLYLANVSSNPATVVANFYLADGSTASSSVTFQVPPLGTQVLKLADVSGLSQGGLHAVIAATTALEGVAHVRNAATGLVGVYSATDCAGATNALFGPYPKGFPSAPAELHLVNDNSEAVTLQADFVALSGGSSYSLMDVAIPAHGSIAISDSMLPDNTTMPADVYAVTIRANVSGVTGVLGTTAKGITTFADRLTSGLESAGLQPYVSNLAALPRLYNGFDIDGTAFSTGLSVISTAATANTFVLNFYNADGSQGGVPQVATVPPGGAKFFGPAWSNLPYGAYSAVIGSQGSLALHSDLVATGPGEGGYGADSIVRPAASDLRLPGLVNNDTVFTIFAVQNVNAMSAIINVQVFNEQGVVAASLQQTVNPGAALSVDLREVAGLPTSFAGSASITSTVEVIAQVDTFSKRITNTPLAGVSVSGPGLAMLDQPVQFTAAVSPTNATTPITYTWQVEGLPDMVNVTPFLTDQAMFSWETTGPKTVTVTAANALGTVTGTWSLRVPAVAVVTTEEPFTLTHEETSGAGARLSVPAGAADAGYTLAVTPISAQRAGSIAEPPPGFSLLGGILLDAFFTDQQVTGFLFDQPATLLMRYTAEQAGLSEESMRLFTLQNNQWVDVAETCDPPSTYVRRPAQNELEVQICHLSPFVLAEPANWLYLPGMRK
jgi:hypothetical protein